jgi:hypothetical protein
MKTPAPLADNLYDEKILCYKMQLNSKYVITMADGFD